MNNMFRLRAKEISILLSYAVFNTILSFAIIHIINNALAGNEEFLQDHMIFTFLSIVVYTCLLNVIFQKWLNKYAFSILYQNEKNLFYQILSAPLVTLEKFGSQRFYTAMDDLRLFSNLPSTVTHTVSSLLMLILGAGYMFSLSGIAAFIVVVLIILMAGCYLIVVNAMTGQVDTLRKLDDRYYRFVNDLIMGFKELKLSASRRKNLMDKYLGPNRDESEQMSFEVSYIFLSIGKISQYGLYFVVAAVLFGLPVLGFLDRERVISYVVIILFISGPINNLINLQQTYIRFIVANKRLKEFMNDFELSKEKERSTHNEDEAFTSLSFKDIHFSYESQSGDSTFALGPVDLEIRKGEVLFIVGGNGSGKSTFINVLTGLYEPTKGEVILNGDKVINIKNDLQNSIAAIFTNNHIFSNNYDDYELEGNKTYSELLRTMQLNQVIKDDKEVSARRSFSKGQSKRLSMIFALLEKKPILVLDEWAADQDPYFRKYFYEELIPNLKREGKTIIAVTHDNAYFNYADRIIKFDYGKILREVRVDNKHELAESLWA